MLPYALIDLHCDTLTALTPEDAPLLAALQDPARREQTVSVFAERVRAVNILPVRHPGRGPLVPVLRHLHPGRTVPGGVRSLLCTPPAQL